MSRKSVNVLTVINSASNITTETINGSEHIVVKGVVPIVDDVVMNGGLYPAAEINQGFGTMERKLMPLGHPKVDGNYVSANDPVAVNDYHGGAFAMNVTKSDGRVVMDMAVNRRYAEAHPKGAKLLERLDAMVNKEQVDPIHISTGLLLNKQASKGESRGKKYTWIASNMQFDHIAILLDEPGAATPDDGVGIFVNAAGDQLQIETVNLADGADCTKEGLINKTKFFFTNASNFSFDDIQRALSQKLREGKPDDCYAWPDSVWPDKFIYSEEGKTYQQKYLIDDDGTAEFVGEPVEVVRKPTEYEIKTNGANNPMKDMIVNALKAKGKPTEGKTDAELFDAFNQMNAEEAAAKTETPEEKAARLQKEADDKAAKDKANNSEKAPAWFTPFAEKLSAIETGLTANSDKEKGEKRSAVKAKFGMTDTAVNALDGEALNELFAKCSTSTGLNGSFRQVNSNETFSEMPE